MSSLCMSHTPQLMESASAVVTDTSQQRNEAEREVWWVMPIFALVPCAPSTFLNLLHDLRCLCSVWSHTTTHVYSFVDWANAVH